MKKEIKEELKNHAPLLAGRKRKPEGYKVPGDYFARMEADIWAQIKPAAETVTEVAPQTSWLDNLIQQVSWLFQPRMAMQLASVALLIAAAFYFIPGTMTPQTDALADLTADEASEYVLANLDDFDTESLMELGFGDDDLSELDAALFEENDVNDLLDELQRENIDLQTLEVYL